MTTADQQIIELLGGIQSGGAGGSGAAAWGAITGTLSNQSDLNTALAGKQPSDADLTAIAALTTTAFGRAFLALADAAATRTAIGLVLGTDIYSKSAVDAGFQPLDSDLTAIAALSTTAFGRGLLAEVSAATLKTTLALNNVDNTADTAKPVSTAQQTALDLKANVASFIRADSAVTQANDANPHAIFTTPANGRLTLATGTYKFRGQLAWTAMSATSGNVKVDILGAGTAVISNWLWRHLGQDLASAQSPGNISGNWEVVSASGASVVSAAVNTAAFLEVNGTFEVNTAGTIIPTQTLVTAAAAVLTAGSFLEFERIGSDTLTSVGAWD